MAISKKYGVRRNAIENERAMIEGWRKTRLQTAYNRFGDFFENTFSLEIVKSFIQNINFMVLVHIIISMAAVSIFQKLNISFDTNVALFVSPIVFPLAFSINSDFQRREKVLEDLACFKSAGMSWYLCMREWKRPAELDCIWLNAVHKKLKSLLFFLCEYLLTRKVERRKIILRAIYEDFSNASELVEKVRASKLPANTAVVSKSIHLLYLMSISFERLRVIRDYRSPRSIRSFNKVFIIMLPIILGPYFVHVGKTNPWRSYCYAIIHAFVFSTLQVVQDKLDDPFDGMGEDDINVDTIDEWAPILEPADRSKRNTSHFMCRQSMCMLSADESLRNYDHNYLEPLIDNNLNDIEEHIEEACEAIPQSSVPSNSSEFTAYSNPEVSDSREEVSYDMSVGENIRSSIIEKEHLKDISLIDDHYYDSNYDIPVNLSISGNENTIFVSHLKIKQPRVTKSLYNSSSYKHLCSA